jgi:PAS domain S-box-containing protein
MQGAQLTAREARRKLYEVIRREDTFEEKAEDAIELGRQYLGADNAHLVRIDEGTDHWKAVVSTDPPDGKFPPGMELDLETTYCRRVLAEESPVALHDAPNQGWEDDVAFETHGLHCYHGTTLLVEDEPWGTVCFVAVDPRKEFKEGETMFAELITRMLEQELERDQHERDLTRQTNLVNVLNRVLRHNLRNDMSVVRAHVHLMADELDDRTHGQKALGKIDELLELSEKARELEWIIGQEHDRRETNVLGIVENIVEEMRTEYPSASFGVESHGDFTATVLPSFKRAIEELVENAAKHGGVSPTVTVAVDRVPNATEIHIVDDGPGLSEQERKALRKGEETPLIHGSGIGLWLVHWIVTSHDGSIETSVTDEGTTLTISIPRQAETETDSPVAELQKARDQYQAAFESSFEAMVIINDEARIVDANPAASDIYGLEKEKLLGRAVPEFLADDFDFETAWAEFQQAGAEMDSVTIVGADGETRPVDYSATTDIVPGQHLVILRDISDR